jgi:hypothetical protein
MSQQQRERALKDFSSVRDVRVMVISLKAGGVGLNLVAASVVFMMDPWWCVTDGYPAHLSPHTDEPMARCWHIDLFMSEGVGLLKP